MLLSDSNNHRVSSPQDVIHQTISNQYKQDFEVFQQNATKLYEVISKNKSLKLIQKQFTKTRTSYKEIEFLYDYTQTNFNYYNINGSPLPKYNQSHTDGKIYDPNGLQTLDELLFSKNVSSQLDKVEEIAKLLKEKTDLSFKIHFPQPLTDRAIFEAMRSGLIRVFALGTSGFDTPSSNNALPEVLTSFRSIKHIFLKYKNYNSTKTSSFNHIKKLFEKGERQLKKAFDFNSFDRILFLKKVINPLYKEIYVFQKDANIKTKQRKAIAQNYNSANIFEENFINTNYYSYRSYIPLDNKKAIALGKKLFSDPILSKNKNMSCITCHNPKLGFTDGLPKSRSSIKGIFTDRNSPTLIDAAFASRQFWDMRTYNLELQVAHVVGNNKEFNSTFDLISNRLKKNSSYNQEFQEIYKDIGKKTIYKRTISNAIAAYVSSLKSFDSKFDQFVRNETTSLSKEAYNGFNLFMGKAACATCHFVPVFNGTIPPFYNETESEVLGVTLGFAPENPIMDTDKGRLGNALARDNLPYFKNSFKTVSLRNVALTAPYMHNGSFNTLEEVMEFYNLGGGAGMGLDVKYQTLSDKPLNLTEKEISDIIAFLHTLTDLSGLD